MSSPEDEPRVLPATGNVSGGRRGRVWWRLIAALGLLVVLVAAVTWQRGRYPTDTVPTPSVPRGPAPGNNDAP